MSFMVPVVTEKQKWLRVETNAGDWWVPLDVLAQSELDQIQENPDVALKYTEGTRIEPCAYPRGIYTISGYGVRLSAPGYMDCTDWEVFTNKREALKRARQLAREED